MICDTVTIADGIAGILPVAPTAESLATALVEVVFCTNISK